MQVKGKKWGKKHIDNIRPPKRARGTSASLLNPESVKAKTWEDWQNADAACSASWKHAEVMTRSAVMTTNGAELWRSQTMATGHPSISLTRTSARNTKNDALFQNCSTRLPKKGRSASAAPPTVHSIPPEGARFPMTRNPIAQLSPEGSNEGGTTKTSDDCLFHLFRDCCVCCSWFFTRLK